MGHGRQFLRIPVAHYFRRSEGPQFLVVRRLQLHTHFYDVVLDWTAEHFPELSRLFLIRHLPYRIPRNTTFALHIPWLQDPVEKWSPRRYAQANRLAAACDARGIPIVNRVDKLINVSKSAFAERMEAAGIRTPRVARIENAEEFRETLCGLALPLFVRPDWGHNQVMLRADTQDEARRLPIESVERPVAVEIVDVGDSKDGLFRKYRYVAAGEIGVSHHLQVSRDWITRGRRRYGTKATRAEELDYISRQDPNHATLQRALRALDLDFAAFDYGYDREGKMVVWEANPYPYIAFSRRSLVYRNKAIDRTVAALVAMYLERAGLAVPESLRERHVYE
jgi:hypothetical protein